MSVLESFSKSLRLTDLKPSLPIGIGGVLLTGGAHILWKQWSKWRTEQQLMPQRPRRLIVITGCDSGLGFSMAFWAARLGYRVIAGCLNLESHGGQILRKEFGAKHVFCVQLDVTKPESIENLVSEAAAFLERNSDTNLRLWAVITNAAVGCFGEAFWLTAEQQHSMMNVNFWGTVNTAKAFEPMLLKYKCRLIVVTSDCAEFPLPALSMYSATKAATHSWALGLRREAAKYGVSVVTFEPGSFPLKSNLFAGQARYCNEMKKSMRPAQMRYYGDYFEGLNKFVIGLFADRPTTSDLLTDQLIYSKFKYVLEANVQHEPTVKAEDMGVKFFHFLIRRLPVSWADPLVLKFLTYPVWNETKSFASCEEDVKNEN